MSGQQMTDRQRIEELLRCPRCKRQLTRNATTLACSTCGATYSMNRDDIPFYNFFIDDRPDEPGRDSSAAWRREGFENGYKVTGYHESGVEFDKQLGYPEEVSRFLFERVKKRMLEWVQPAAGHTILDVGCGAGYFLYLIREKYQASGFEPTLVGLDISENQLSYMLLRMKKEGITDAVAIHGNGEYLPFEDESFDLVTCSEVLEHIRTPQRALAEIHRVLKPTGLALLSTPSMMAQKGWSYLLGPLAVLVKAIRRYKSQGHKPEGYYEIPWYPIEFREAIQNAQLRIQDFNYNAVIPHPWHFRFLPRPLVKPVVYGFKLVDSYLKFLFKPLALHFVVRATKGSHTKMRATS